MGEHIIKCRGLPWSTTAKDIVSFFHDCSIVNGESGVHLPLDKNGRASGECFVELASAQDVQTAKGHDKEHMGSRYVEIHESERQEMDWALNRGSGGGGMGGGGGGMGGGFGGGMGGGGGSEFVVKLRGLPYSATKKDIVDFFSDIQVNQYGITINMGNDGRPSGEAFVELTSQDDVEKACAKNRETMGSRYIEVFKSNKQEIQFASNGSGGFGGGGGRGGGPMSSRGGRGRSGPYDRPGGLSSSHGAAHALGPSGFNTAGMVTRGGGRGGRGGGRGGSQMGGGDSTSPGTQPSTTGFMVHMRGLPFEATQGDVFKFFAPLNPVEVRILYEDSGRAKGQCDVDFASYADVESAMQKDKQNMGHRYIELFNRCDDSAPRGPPGGGWGNNSGPMLPQNRNGPGGGWNSGGNSGPPSGPPNMQQGGYGGGYGQGGGGGFNNMGGGFSGGYGGGNNNGYGGYNSGPPQQNSGYGNYNDNKQGYQMPQAAGGNYY